MAPVLYFDLGSPYAYLAVERAETVLGHAPELQPVLLGAIFGWRGHGSWARTDQRQAGMAEVERRAQRYGLPPLVWPPGWPTDGLAAMRAATWARARGCAGPFARAVFRRQFAAGGDIADPTVLADCAERAGLDPEAMSAALGDAHVKDALKVATGRAWEAGVRGVPTLRVSGDLLRRRPARGGGGGARRMTARRRRSPRPGKIPPWPDPGPPPVSPASEQPCSPR